METVVHLVRSGYVRDSLPHIEYSASTRSGFSLRLYNDIFCPLLCVSLSRSSSIATKCMLVVCAVTLAPVWITRPECRVASLQGASVTTVEGHPSQNPHLYNHTHNSSSCSSFPPPLQSLGQLCRLWPGSALAAQRQEDGTTRAAAAVVIPTLVHRK